MFGKYHANSKFPKVQIFTTKIYITLLILVGWGHGCIHMWKQTPSFKHNILHK
jgi:hypothetical protein